MHLKKRIMAVLSLAVLTATILYGSTLKMSGKVEEPSRLSWFDRKDTIYFWYSDDTLTNYVNSAAVAFGEKEGIHVLPVLIAANEYLEEVNSASLKEEQLPDVYLISHDSLEKAYLAGLAEEVDTDCKAFAGGCFPNAALDSVTYHGKVIAYPLSFDTSALLYNETYLREWAAQLAQKEMIQNGEDTEEEPEDDSTGIAIDETMLAKRAEEIFLSAVPDTLDDILTIADTFDVPEGVEGVIKWDVSDIFYNYWIVGQYMVVGGDSGDDKENISIQNPNTIACLEIYKSLNQFFSIDTEEIAYEEVLTDFMEGKTVFTIATTDAVAKLEEARANNTLGFTYGVTTMPAVSTELLSRSMSVTNAVAVNGYSRHKELANRFAEYLTDEYAGELYARSGKVSVNVFVNTGNEALQAFIREYAESIPLPKMMETGNYWLLLERLFSKVWNNAEVTPLVEELATMIEAQTSIAQ